MKKISFCSFGTPQSFAEYKATDVIRTLQHAFIDQGWDVFLFHNNLQTSQKALLFISEKPELLLLKRLLPYRHLIYWLRIWSEASTEKFMNEYNDDVLFFIQQCAGCGSLIKEEQEFFASKGISCQLLPLGSHRALRSPYTSKEFIFDLYIHGEGSQWQRNLVRQLRGQGISCTERFNLSFTHRDDALRISRRMLLLPDSIQTRSITPPHLVAMALYHHHIPITLCQITQPPWKRWCQITNWSHLIPTVKTTPHLSKSIRKFQQHSQKKLLNVWEEWLS